MLARSSGSVVNHSGGFPLSGLMTTDAIASPDHPERSDPWTRPSFSSSSYGGSPLSAAAGDAVTRVIVDDDLPGNAARVGAALLEALQPMASRYDFVGEVRGVGLLIGIDLVADKVTRAPLAKADCEWIFRRCLEKGLLTMSYTARVRLNPPLVITRDQALEGAAILDETFAEFDAVRSRA